ncbi:Alpha-hemolysin translocation ATP-binding protein HlyB [Piscirickettsia salmonis]|uniref:ABC transporter family protein n=2 Tax=Piscirickettsia salmonis TaxID=1238 RepID=A0A1L6T9Z6_PISSA|nr:ABC transporter transmembrane domain-containing protein [Piscirickettsia salmonis]AIE90167.1 type I secretion system ATPase [Piscirickettsia salmonis LF-89 = ATCC VR-1361]ALB22017.1 ABC transporter family protein [Piscirickettsia salmonis]ALT18216.1 ABC transporter family protein [Piscirickettsia salmonis LF-89 = ATCC VR-1361]ALY02161.1 ABC transporter family protein [Piscirickettsia salmonis]AMA41675.1 ABC transporter family protein [Piscirickettsia salmonis]
MGFSNSSVEPRIHIFSAWENAKHILATILLVSLLINILSLAFPLALLQVYDRIIPNSSLPTLYLLTIGVLVALTLETLFRISRSYVSAWADAKFEHQTSCNAFKTMINSTLSEYEQRGHGVHLEQINSLSQLRDFYAGQAITSLIDIPFVLIFIFLIAYIGGVLIFVPLIIITAFILFTIFINQHLKALLMQRREHEDRRLNFIIEVLQSIHTIKSMTMEAQMLRRYERLQGSSAINDHKLSIKASQVMSFGLLVSQLSMVATVAVGALLVLQGQLTIGGLAACTLLSGRCLQPINRATSVWNRLQSIRIAEDKLQEVFKLPPEYVPTQKQLAHIDGHICFEHVNFRYDKNNNTSTNEDDENWLFKNISLDIPAKTTVGITGDGLSGKSSLLWLIMGLYQPDQGRILIDDHDIQKLKIQNIRQHIAYLPQHGDLFNGTIIDNLTLFQEQKYYKQAIEVSQLLGLDSIIERLPKGYHTPVANHAMESLPRGIIQRIAIARALIHKPPIVLFDEANTAMDMQGDTILINVLEQLKGTCTLILVSHRPSLLAHADKIFILENKNLVEKVT